MKTDFVRGGLSHMLVKERSPFGLYELWNRETGTCSGYTVLRWVEGKWPQQKFISSHYTMETGVKGLLRATIGAAPEHTARNRSL